MPCVDRRIRKEFPEARIALIGVNTPASWTKRPRAREWNTVVMSNMQGIECDAVTIHIYPKNALASPTPYDMIGQTLAAVAQGKVLDASIDSSTNFGLPNTISNPAPIRFPASGCTGWPQRS